MLYLQVEDQNLDTQQGQGEGRSYLGDMGDNMTFPEGMGDNFTFSGEVGQLDPAYCQMLMNSGDQLMTSQVPLKCVCSLCQGNKGPKGDQGPRGYPGRPGSPGRRGLIGFRGRPGFMGSPGLKGQKGDEGPKGDGGPLGPLGPKGQRGYKGDKGDVGVEGPSGQPGTKGDEGVCPPCEVVEGPPGQPGLPGSPGPRGLPGRSGPAGPSGPMGDPGDLGPAGLPGRPGPKGEVGPEGNCTCEEGRAGEKGAKGAKGEDGKDGIQGPVGPVGPSGPKGEVGPMGVAGVEGPMGPMGLMGAPGPCMPAIQSSFSAGLEVSYPPPMTPVVFSEIINNRQGHYNPTAGVYTAPVNGTYVFSYSLTVYNRILKVGMFRNISPVVKTTNTALLGITAHTVTLHLDQGDEVYLMCKDWLTNGVFTSSETSSTFSGFLLYPDTCYLYGTREFIPTATSSPTEYAWGELPGGTSPPATMDQYTPTLTTATP
ncbi:unnamed protein product [Merluccius merluccius]